MTQGFAAVLSSIAFFDVNENMVSSDISIGEGRRGRSLQVAPSSWSANLRTLVAAVAPSMETNSYCVTFAGAWSAGSLISGSL